MADTSAAFDIVAANPGTRAAAPTAIARIEVLDDLAAAEPVWRILQSPERVTPSEYSLEAASRCWKSTGQGGAVMHSFRHIGKKASSQ